MDHTPERAGFLFYTQNMERVTMHDIYERWHRNDINKGVGWQ